MEIVLRKPIKNDAKKIYNLVKDTKVLDLNSEYLYLLQCTHFKDTCCVALYEEEVVGFVSGYIVPGQNDVLFIWQVGVDERFRGKSVAGKLILEILNSNSSKNIKYIHTTISPSNRSSQRLFEKVAGSLKGNLVKEEFFKVEDFNNAHEDEILYKIDLEGK